MKKAAARKTLEVAEALYDQNFLKIPDAD